MAREHPSEVVTHPVPGGAGAIVLLVVGPGLPRVVPLARDEEIRIGRASSAQIVVDDGSLSRHHAAFWLRDGYVEVEDLGSSNGTVVRGARIASGVKARVEVGEAIQLGTVLVVVQRRTGASADEDRLAASATPSDELVARIAASTITVLLLGETGVGKEVMAERLHAESPRSKGPLVKINCAALSPSVLESELFGHERGSFTGAVREKPGLIESADGGTLFLDEIGEADPAVQVKLLRVLETRETQRIGALRPKIVDVRFIAATNREPARQIESGKLRADLYYRLAGFTITIPPLRERRAQIPTLAHELLARHSSGALSPDAVARLLRHDWPGNVRELRNVLERARLIAEGPEISVAAIDEALRLEPVAEVQRSRPASEPQKAPADPEKARILAVLDECGGNQSAAAEKLGMSRRALVYRLQAWGMTRPRRK